MVGCALDAELAAEESGEVARDRQPETGAAVATVRRAVGLSERFEDHVVLIARDADAGVRDLERDASVGLAANGELHAAAIGELARVRQQVLEDLLDARRVRHQLRGHAGIDDGLEREVLVVRHRREDRLHLLDDLLRRDVFDPYVELAGLLDLREVEDVVDEEEEIVARRVDRLGELHLLGRQVAVAVVGEQPREDERAVQRRAQLVRHVREELRLVRARALRDRLAREGELVPLRGERGSLLLELRVDLLDLGLLLLEPRLRAAKQRRALLLELFVADAELLLLRLELLGLTLRLLEQLLDLTAITRGTQRDAEDLAAALNQIAPEPRQRLEEAELDRAVAFAVDRRRSDQQPTRPRRAER